jgi:predicted nucleic acid-binding protein
MTYSYVIDTFAWIEYLNGSNRGAAAREYIEDGRAATPTIVLFELVKWFLREIEADRRTPSQLNQTLEFAKARTLIVDLDERHARKAGETDFQMKKKIHNWPVADSVIYTTASTVGASVVSGDPHFKSLPDVIMI